jgi:hypothetical protein
MPNTTNYSFPTPADTDLVKNGADAIRDLGDAVDTAMNTALGTKKSGLVLLNTTSFSGVSSQSFNDVFSATYDYYKVILDYAGSTNGITMSMRMRVSGSDNSTSNYNRQLTNTSDTTYTGLRVNSQTSWGLPGLNTDRTTNIMEFQNPFNTAPTAVSQFINVHYNSTTLNIIQHQTLGFAATTSFTGFSIICAANNMTGSVSIFGYNK